MIAWKNMDTLASYEKLRNVKRVELASVMSGEGGAQRVKTYSVPMGAGMAFNYGARPVDDEILSALSDFAQEAQLTEKFAALYNGEVINTGEKRLVLHHLCRGQLGQDVVADGVNKREFYLGEQKKIADFANKVHSGQIANAAGEKFTTVCQIGIGGSDLGPRALYIALKGYCEAEGIRQLNAEFISNVDPDDAADVMSRVNVETTLFVLVSKSGTTLETLTNQMFVINSMAEMFVDVFFRDTITRLILELMIKMNS